MRLRYEYGNEPMSREPTRAHGSYFDLQRFSADGTLNFDTKVDTDGLEEGTDEVGAKASKLGSIFETGLGVLAGNLMTEAVGKIKELGAEVVNAGADYEQLVGGVQKLYGNMGQSLEEYAAAQGKSTAEVKDDWQALEDAQNLALKNAQTAYKTSGMSMNEYMETATSFSASLINALGGDTVKAAEQTDIAMQAISDNVNTFGSDAEAVKNAFMGFSKENYSMLDNLKLGYGGTKTEMERLIADANEWGAANGEASNLSIDSFSDVVTAIQQIQEKQNIAGTTAREAASTYSGSLAMLQSAWTNVLTAISSGENLSAAMQSLGESLVAYGGNAVKMLGTIVSQIPSFLSASVAMIGTVLADSLPMVQSGISSLLDGMKATLDSDGLGKMLDSGKSMVTNLAQGLTNGIPKLLAQALPLMVQFSENLRKNVGKIVDMGLELIVGLVQGIANGLPQLIQYAPQIIMNIAETINDNMPKILATGVTIIQTMAMGIVNAIPALIANFPQICQSIFSVIKAVNWLSLGGSVITGINNGVRAIMSNIPSTFRSIASNIRNVFSSIDWGSVGKAIIKGIANGIKNFGGLIVDAAKSAAKSALKAAKNALGIHSPSKVFRDEVGRNTMLGMAEGIEQNTNAAVEQMQDSAQRVTDAATSIPTGEIISGAQAATRSATSGLNEGLSERSATITVPLYIDGREFARAEAPYLNKQLAWEA